MKRRQAHEDILGIHHADVRHSPHMQSAAGGVVWHHGRPHPLGARVGDNHRIAPLLACQTGIRSHG